MCGICGYIFHRGAIGERKKLVQKMCDLLVHRGPDEQGLISFDNVALGHRRLSIIDLAEGQQPMANSEQTLWIVFNGEIYNYRELRNELAGNGFSFRTNSDTEVILNGYAAYGTSILDRLNGMFAFAIYDRRSDLLFAARDRLGKKPLYYYSGPDRFVFSSELKSLLADPEMPRDINFEAVDKFFSYTYVPAPLTIFRNISKLRPGHFMICEAGRVTVKQYWDVQYRLPEKPLEEDEYIEELDSLLKASVKRRLISEVPLGAFLSGGVDSSLVVALMSHLSSEPVRTFSIGFNERRYTELEDASIVAKALKSDHHERIVTPDTIELLPEIIWHTSEPFADSSAMPTYCVSRFAREMLTVALSGDGGDELFAGYNRYIERDKYKAYLKIPRAIREHVIAPFASSLPIGTRGKFFLHELGRLGRRQHNDIVEIFPDIKHALYSDQMRGTIKGLPVPESSFEYWSNRPGSSRLSEMQYLDTKVYLSDDILTKVDRMSMANSLETRAPLLDYKVVEFAASIPPHMHMLDGRGKYLLRKVAGRYLPQSVMDKKKQGFAVPRDEWFRGPLIDYAENLLKSKLFRSRGYFKQGPIDLILTEHIKGKRDYSTWIWCLIVFELWHQLFMDPATRRI